MANRVLVGFNKKGLFTFCPRQLDVKGERTIIFEKDSTDASWKFVTVNVVGQNWKQTNEDGVFILVNDPDLPLGQYPYIVTVQDSKGNHSSPATRIDQDEPPIIKNDGSGDP
jgi:hypothetical protein